MHLSPPNASHPAPIIRAITPGANSLDPRPRALYIATSGTIDIENEDETTVDDLPVIAGSVLPVQAFKVTAAGSGATVFGLFDR